MLPSDIGNLLDNSATQLGDMVAEFSAAFEGRVHRPGKSTQNTPGGYSEDTPSWT
jgi:hypothetical protein